MYECYIDGSITQNPNGHMSCGGYVSFDNKIIYEFHSEILQDTDTSNNLAEYHGLFILLQNFPILNRKLSNEITIYTDSKLLQKQMLNRLPIVKGAYVKLAEKCKNMVDYYSDFWDIKFRWIPRKENKQADKLSKTRL